MHEEPASDFVLTNFRSLEPGSDHPKPLGFFLSVASPRAERPNALIALVPLGGLALGTGAVVLGIGLLA